MLVGFFFLALLDDDGRRRTSNVSLSLAKGVGGSGTGDTYVGTRHTHTSPHLIPTFFFYCLFHSPIPFSFCVSYFLCMSSVSSFPCSTVFSQDLCYYPLVVIVLVLLLLLPLFLSTYLVYSR